MATLTIQTINSSSIVPTTQAVDSGGDEYDNTNSNVFGEIYNDHATLPRTLTIITQKTVDGLAVADRDIIITAANERRFFGPYQAVYYNDGDNLVQLTYSDSGADMRIAVYKLG
jgi:hypothetical protein